MLRSLLGKSQAKPSIFVLCTLPFFYLLWGASNDALGANPAEYLIRATGNWTLRFLCITLAITPLRVVVVIPELLRLRRMLGLFVYFYVVIHLLC
jgi:sulfoxide reductase heme-binding subunit YedZ